MLKQHVSLSYHHAKLDVLDVFAVGVRNGIFNNPGTFAAVPITQLDFQALIDNYINTRGAYVQGGLAQKGPFLNAKVQLITALDNIAEYVDELADGNANIITLAGFVPTKPGSTEHPAPAQPMPAELKRGASGELFAEIPAVPDAEYYGCIVFKGFPLPNFIAFNPVGQLVVTNTEMPNPNAAEPFPTGNIVYFDLNKNRKKKFVGLTPHTVYYVYYYAANATGVSPLSLGSSLECL